MPIVVVEETIATSPPTRHVSGSYSNNNKKHLSTVLEVEAMAKVLESLEQHEALAQNQVCTFVFVSSFCDRPLV